ncbi:MAG TPA: PDDEXK nuclease domain-containing protein [Gammaproteobacteria bacterium]|jgi:predicted nuclease of restriction endonuclease-like (RecB) superfamily|nr:PDDEXK nuclease domain-containing protein [Gammaproteobacteria bacterium]
MTKDIELTDYKLLLEETKQTIMNAQQHFLQQATRTNIELYWQLGKLLARTAERYQWGKQILARLSHDLTKVFASARGYSEQNLRHMRQFYYEYAESPDLLDIAKNVRWSTNLLIMHKVKMPEARKFYLQMASDSMCNRDIIELQIKSEAYERECLQDKKHNFSLTLPHHQAARADNILKASYFLEISKPFIGSHSLLERQIENEMVARIKEVIMMLGKGFAFIGNQYRIVAKGNEYLIDLLFFNRITRSLFAVELKTRKFKAEYAGKMNLYLGLLDDYVKQPDENPSIGLILCTNRNFIEAEYALRDINKPIGVAEIKLSKILPKELIGKLPDPKELENEILHEIQELDNLENGDDELDL